MGRPTRTSNKLEPSGYISIKLKSFILSYTWEHKHRYYEEILIHHCSQYADFSLLTDHSISRAQIRPDSGTPTGYMAFYLNGRISFVTFLFLLLVPLVLVLALIPLLHVLVLFLAPILLLLVPLFLYPFNMYLFLSDSLLTFQCINMINNAQSIH